MFHWCLPSQAENTEADGFQADTEEDEEDDCVCISTESGKFHQNWQ